MKTICNIDHPDTAFESTYALLVRSEEKQRSDSKRSFTHF